MRETVQLGLVFHIWPFSTPLHAMSQRDRRLLIEITTDCLPPPYVPPDAGEGQDG